MFSEPVVSIALAKNEIQKKLVDAYNKIINKEKIDIILLDEIPILYKYFIINNPESKPGQFYWDVLQKYEPIYNLSQKFPIYFWASFYVPIHIIIQNPHLPWNWANIQYNESVTWDFIVKNPAHPWNFSILSSNPNITFDIVKNNPDPYEVIRTSAALSMMLHRLPPRTQWSYYTLSYRTPIKTILENPNPHWDYYWVSEKATIEEIEAHPERKWSMLELSGNENINMQYVLSRPKLRWYISELSANPSIKMEDIIANPQFDWQFHEVSRNPNFTHDTPKKYPWLPWSFENYWMNENISLEVLKNPPCEINYDMLSANPSLPIQFVLENPDKPWNYTHIFTQNKISLDILIDWATSGKILRGCLTFNTPIYKIIKHEYNNYMNNAGAHFARLDEIHGELMEVLFSPDNLWYFENLK